MEKRTETLTDGVTQQDEPPQSFVGLITVPMLCRLQQLCPFVARRQHSMPFILGPDHIATIGIDCISKNNASSKPLEQRRRIARIAWRNNIALRISFCAEPRRVFRQKRYTGVFLYQLSNAVISLMYGGKSPAHLQLKETVSMKKYTLTAFAALGLLVASTTSQAVAQHSDDKTMHGKDKMNGKMSEKEHTAMMQKMDKMSVEDKASMMDKMSAKDRMGYMKGEGSTTASMSEQEHTAMMAKMSTQEKADAFDKWPMETRMAAMRHQGMMHKGTRNKAPKN